MVYVGKMMNSKLSNKVWLATELFHHFVDFFGSILPRRGDVSPVSRRLGEVQTCAGVLTPVLDRKMDV